MNRIKQFFKHVAPCEVLRIEAPRDADFAACAGRAIDYCQATHAPVLVVTAYGGLCALLDSDLAYLLELFADVKELALLARYDAVIKEKP